MHICLNQAMKNLFVISVSERQGLVMTNFYYHANHELANLVLRTNALFRISIRDRPIHWFHDNFSDTLHFSIIGYLFSNIGLTDK